MIPCVLRALGRPKSLQLAVGRMRARAHLRGCALGEGVNAGGYVRAAVAGEATIGPRVSFAGGMVATELVVAEGAVLSIGAETFVNYGVSVEARHQIRIGARCLIASFVRISDESSSRRGPVVVGDDVWLAHGAIIEPGVTIGAGSVVAAGAVVTADVPPNVVVMGNPARVQGPARPRT